MAITKQEVDARVQAVVENLQAGRGVEDDAGIELKADWPDPLSKARQLAGAANALRGEPFILVIGVDDKSGAVTVPAKVEPHEWYAKARKPFDQIAPELLWVQTVHGGRPPASVLAMVFATDEFPYVINSENRREIPLRVGTGTESAHRNQIVRMFEPSLRAPTLTVTETDIYGSWRDENPTTPREDSGTKERIGIRISGRIFIEHSGTKPIILPARDMRFRLVCEDFETRPEVRVINLGESEYPRFRSLNADPLPEPVPPQYGVYARDNHVVATAPGEFSFSGGIELSGPLESGALLAQTSDLLAAAESMHLDVALRVVGVESLVKVSADMVRSKAATGMKSVQTGQSEVLSRQLGEWQLQVVDFDPWA